MANPNKHPATGKFSSRTMPGMLPAAHHAKMVKTTLNTAQMSPRQHAARTVAESFDVLRNPPASGPSGPMRSPF